MSGNLGERGVCGGEIVAWFRNIPKFLLCLFRLDRVVGVVSEDVTIDFVAYFNGQREQATLRDDGLRPGQRLELVNLTFQFTKLGYRTYMDSLLGTNQFLSNLTNVVLFYLSRNLKARQ